MPLVFSIERNGQSPLVLVRPLRKSGKGPRLSRTSSQRTAAGARTLACKTSNPSCSARLATDLVTVMSDIRPKERGSNPCGAAEEPVTQSRHRLQLEGQFLLQFYSAITCIEADIHGALRDYERSQAIGLIQKNAAL